MKLENNMRVSPISNNNPQHRSPKSCEDSTIGHLQRNVAKTLHFTIIKDDLRNNSPLPVTIKSLCLQSSLKMAHVEQNFSPHLLNTTQKDRFNTDGMRAKSAACGDIAPTELPVPRIRE